MAIKDERLSVTLGGKAWHATYDVTPDAIVKVSSAYGSDEEHMAMDDETIPEQAERMFRAILARYAAR